MPSEHNQHPVLRRQRALVTGAIRQALAGPDIFAAFWRLALTLSPTPSLRLVGYDADEQWLADEVSTAKGVPAEPLEVRVLRVWHLVEQRTPALSHALGPGLRDFVLACGCQVAERYLVPLGGTPPPPFHWPRSFRLLPDNPLPLTSDPRLLDAADLLAALELASLAQVREWQEYRRALCGRPAPLVRARLEHWRCPYCRRALDQCDLAEGKPEVRCHRCAGVIFQLR